jgi:hypothetical protein
MRFIECRDVVVVSTKIKTCSELPCSFYPSPTQDTRPLASGGKPVGIWREAQNVVKTRQMYVGRECAVMSGRLNVKASTE